jgi:prophage regulatory protein
MSIRILSVNQVIDRTGLSRRTLYQEISEHRFPRPIQLTARRVGWPELDIETWLIAKIEKRDGAIA